MRRMNSPVGNVGVCRCLPVAGVDSDIGRCSAVGQFDFWSLELEPLPIALLPK